MKSSIGNFLAIICGLTAFTISEIIASTTFPIGVFEFSKSDGQSIWIPLTSVFTTIVFPLLISIAIVKIIIKLMKRVMNRRIAENPDATPTTDNQQRTTHPATRIFVMIVAVMYLATWLFGAPAVQSSLNKSAVDMYKTVLIGKDYKISAKDDPEVRHLPVIRTPIQYPLLPGVVVSYHEYQVAGLWGWGGWKFHLWYICGTKELFDIGVWIS